MTAEEAFQLFAVTAPGLEDVVARELVGLGTTPSVEAGGVAWDGGLRSLSEANLPPRAASRVLVRVTSFRARSFIELERHLRRIDWTPYTAPRVPAAFRVSSRKSRLYHQRAIEERFAREYAAATGGETRVGGGAGSGEDDADGAEAGEQLFIVRFQRDVCTVSADASGALLHRRGYRQAVARAPLRETLAAALLHVSGWTPGEALLDPFCGSGTIPIEAALIARDVAPGLANEALTPREYAFTRWPGFDAGLFDEVVDAARLRVRDEPVPILRGSDRDEGAIRAAQANAERAGVRDMIEFEVRTLSAAAPSEPAGWIITNPPYGVRVGEERPLRDLYATLGRIVRESPGWRIAMISANEQLERATGMELTRLLATRNGGIAVRVASGGGMPPGGELPPGGGVPPGAPFSYPARGAG